MDTKQFNEKEIPVIEVAVLTNEAEISLIKMKTHFEISMLQASLDYEDKTKDELIVIVLDKLLRLNFPESYIAFYGKNNNILTEDEKNYIENPNSLNNLIFVKNNLQEAKFIYKVTINNSIYSLILKNDKYFTQQLNFINWGLSQNE